MFPEKRKMLFRLVAVIAIIGHPAALLAASGSFEESVTIDGAAIIDVSNQSGTVKVRGDDVDQVTIYARIKIDKKLSNSDPDRAGQIVRAIKRSPPIVAENNRIVIGELKRRAYQRHASVSYEIIVPRETEVNVHSISGNVHVSGVTGQVNATSEKGEVILAENEAVAAPAAKFCIHAKLKRPRIEGSFLVNAINGPMR